MLLCLQQFNLKSKMSADTLSQFSLDSATSVDSKDTPLYIAAGDIRRRLSENITVPKKKFDVRKLMAVMHFVICFYSELQFLNAVAYIAGRVSTCHGC